MQDTERKAPGEYRHKEAFMLMRYKCERCGSIEWLWNSRDGVTPFCVNCIKGSCGGIAQHVTWQLDTRAILGQPLACTMLAMHALRAETRIQPGPWEPPEGMRVFLDLSAEKAAMLAEQRMKIPELSQYLPDDARDPGSPGWFEYRKRLVESMLDPAGAPTVEHWPILPGLRARPGGSGRHG